MQYFILTNVSKIIEHPRFWKAIIPKVYNYTLIPPKDCKPETPEEKAKRENYERIKKVLLDAENTPERQRERERNKKIMDDWEKRLNEEDGIK